MGVAIDPAGLRHLARELDERSSELDDLMRRAERLGMGRLTGSASHVSAWSMGHTRELRVSAGIIDDLDRRSVDWAHALTLYGLPTEIERVTPRAGQERLAELQTLLADLPSDYSPARSADAVAAWFASISPQEAAWLATYAPTAVGNLDGAPNSVRYAANRISLLRTQAEESQRYDSWRRHPPQPGKAGHVDYVRLEKRLQWYREWLLTEVRPRMNSEGRRIEREVGRQLLVFAGPTWSSDGQARVVDDGRIAEVLGSLDTASHIGFMVPGVTNRLDNFNSLREAGLRLHGNMDRQKSAVVVWLGYDTPEFAEAVAPSMAEQGGPVLRSAVDGLRHAPEADVTVLAHSYGTVTTSQALQAGMRPDRVVLMGSPGLGRDIRSASDLGLPSGYPIYALRAPADWVSYTEGHGADPVTLPGITRLATQLPDTDASRGHSEYYKRASGALRNLANVVSGRVGQSVSSTLVDEQVGAETSRLVVNYVNHKVDPAYQYALMTDLEPIIQQVQEHGMSQHEAIRQVTGVLSKHDLSDKLSATEMAAVITTGVAKEAGHRYIDRRAPGLTWGKD